MTASSHAYLGDLEDVLHPLPSFLEAGSVVTLPLLYLPDVVLFPGDQLPLRMLSEGDVDAIGSHLRQEGALLAVLCSGQRDDEANYGTTVRIERYNLSGRSTTITGSAKQRFRVCKLRRMRSRVYAAEAQVEILPDHEPLRVPAPWSSPFVRRPCARMESPFYWTMDQYKLFDAHWLMRRIKHILRSETHWNWFRHIAAVANDVDSSIVILHQLRTDTEVDPLIFSFWLAGNLPMDQGKRLELHRVNCVVRRLRMELELIENHDMEICCANCGHFLAHTSDIFSKSTQGAAGTFVNPHGYVHQILTLMAIDQSHTICGEEQSAEDSWFPGYAWSILNCRFCLRHLGWRFDIVEEPREETETVPATEADAPLLAESERATATRQMKRRRRSSTLERFYGLRHTSLTICSASNVVTSDPEEEPSLVSSIVGLLNGTMVAVNDSNPSDLEGYGESDSQSDVDSLDSADHEDHSEDDDHFDEEHEQTVEEGDDDDSELEESDLD